MKGKCKIQRFERDVLPVSIDSACINDKEEENIDTEHKLSSDVDPDSKNNISV